MAFDGKSLDNYNTVAERLEKFRADHPEGRTRPTDPSPLYDVVRVPNGWCRRCRGDRVAKIRGDWQKCPRCDGSGVRPEHEPQEDVFIVYAAAVYRDAGDELPGIGMAWEPYPGRTPYTERSELMNAETSAIGRGMVAANLADARKGIATADEIQSREAEREQDSSGGNWTHRPIDQPSPKTRKRRTPTKTTGPEHEQLRGGTVEAVPEDRPAQRTKRPTEGQWEGQPPGPPLDRGMAYDTAPGSADSKILKTIHIQLSALGIKERVAQLARLEAMVNGPLDGPHQAEDGTNRTSKNLSSAEAHRIWEALAAEVKDAETQAKVATP